MKKLVFIVTLFATAMTAYAQSDEPSSFKDEEQPKFRRSSLYTLKLDTPKDKDEYQEALKLIDRTYNKLPIPDAYNDFSLTTRHINYTVLGDVTKEEMDQYKKSGKGGGFGKFAKGVGGMAAGAVGVEVNTNTVPEEEYVAKLMNYFKSHRFANKLVAKWHNKIGVRPDTVDWDDNLEIMARFGLVGLSEEEKARIKENGGSLTSAAQDNECDIVPNTYVVVNRYGFITGAELVEEMTAPLTAQLASASPIVAVGLQKGIDAIKKKYATGYFVRCYAYLFQLQYTEEDYNGFYNKYWENPDDFANAKYELKYIGKSQGRARARKADDGNIIGIAVQRATDKCYADLQHDNEQFRPLAALHEDDGKLVAYIGTKEGVTEKSQFDVFEMQVDKKGKMSYKKVGSLKVQKGCVWENRAGADEILEEDDDEEIIGDTSLKYTIFTGKPGKIGEGNFIKLAK